MRVLVTALLAATLAACGGSERDRDAPAERGRLVVSFELARQAVYQEGSLGYLRVADADSGEVAREARVTGPVGPAPGPEGPRVEGVVFDERVAAGRYHVVSWQRPCSGNCEFLDEPSARCEVVVTVGAGRTVRRVIELDRRGCTFASD